MEKSAVGAVLNIDQKVANVILGIPPLMITNKVNTVKFYLKLFSSGLAISDDRLIEFIQQNVCEKTNVMIVNHLRDLGRFLKWKLKLYPKEFTPEDVKIICDPCNCISNYILLSNKCCGYTRKCIKLYTEHLWQESMDSAFQLEGSHRSPRVSTSNLPIPSGTSREEEVLMMSMLYAI